MASAAIYKIRDRITGKCYIGCTTNPVDVRMWQHEKAGQASGAYEVMKDKAWDFEVLEKCCADLRFIREKHWIEQYKDYCVNRMGKPLERTYREDRLNNRGEYTHTGIDTENMSKAEYNRKYKTEVRKKETQAYNQAYYDKNRERLTAKHDCGCGGRFCQLTRSQHFGSKKHLNWAMSQFVQQVEEQI